MNSFCTPPEWNTDELLTPFRELFPNYKNLHVRITFLHDTGPNAEPVINAVVTDNVGRSLHTIGDCKISNFTKHCGIRALSYIRVRLPKWLPQDPRNIKYAILWVRTIEAFLHSCEYSLILASDGPGGITDWLLRQVPGWLVSHPGINRRMGNNHTIHLWQRYLNDGDLASINWSDQSFAVTTPIIQKEVKKASA